MYCVCYHQMIVSYCMIFFNYQIQNFKIKINNNNLLFKIIRNIINNNYCFIFTCKNKITFLNSKTRSRLQLNLESCLKNHVIIIFIR